MSKIHFACCFCVDYDMDLLPLWGSYYREFGFDSYHVFLHSYKTPEPENILFFDQCEQKFANLRFEVQWVTGRFGRGELRAETLKPLHDSFPKDDYMVSADSDEIQDVPINYRSLIEENEVIEGQLIDCWGPELKNYDPSKPVYEQYPNKGDLFNLKGYLFQVHPIRNKILAAKCCVPVNYLGSHHYNPPTLQFKKKFGFEVLHYTYRESYLQRMFDRWYYPSNDIYNMMRIFNVPTNHPMMKKLHDREVGRFKERGWIPASFLEEEVKNAVE